MEEKKSYRFSANKSLLLNQMLWGMTREQLTDTAQLLHYQPDIDIDNMHVCLTGISHRTIQHALQMDGLSYFASYYIPCCNDIKNRLFEIGYNSVFFLPAFDKNQRICFLFSPIPGRETDSAEKAAEIIHGSLCNLYKENRLPATLFNYTVYTELGYGFEELPRVYPKLVLLCESLFFIPKSILRGAAQFVDRDKSALYDMTRDTNKLENAISGGNIDEATSILEKCVWEHLRPIRSMSMLKSFVIIITEKINRILFAYKIDDRIEESSLYPENFNNILEFYRALLGAVTDITGVIVESGKQLPSFLYEAILYIREHVNEDISLQNIADYVYVSPSYLSRSFNSVMGKGISAYILNERMEIAEQLLCTTDFTGTEVAVKVGIHSNSYFTKLFCERFGMPPSEYRKLHSRKNS